MNLGPLSSAEDWAASHGRLADLDWRNPRMAVNEVDTPETELVPAGSISRRDQPISASVDRPRFAADADHGRRQLRVTPEGGSLDTAAETGEGQVKPEGDVLLPDATCVARTIAHFIKVRRQQLADLPKLATTINSRLSYGVERRLETQSSTATGSARTCWGFCTRAGSERPRQWRATPRTRTWPWTRSSA